MQNVTTIKKSTSPSLLWMLGGVLVLMTGCASTPRVLVAPDVPARIESFDRLLGRVQVVYLTSDGPRIGWVKMSELEGRTVIRDDVWLQSPTKK